MLPVVSFTFTGAVHHDLKVETFTGFTVHHVDSAESWDSIVKEAHERLTLILEAVQTEMEK